MIKFHNTEILGLGNMVDAFKRTSAFPRYSDSGVCDWVYCFDCDNTYCPYAGEDNIYEVWPTFRLGENDLKIFREHLRDETFNRKYEKYVSVRAYIEAPLYWWADFNAYKEDAIVYNDSFIIALHNQTFERCDFCSDSLVDISGSEQNGIQELFEVKAESLLNGTIAALNAARSNYLRTKEEPYLRQIYQLLPSCYIQKSLVEIKFPELHNIYKLSSHDSIQKKEWIEFRKWCESIPWFSKMYLEE